MNGWDPLLVLEDEGNDPAMTSGLLHAQQKRFDRLWRIQVSICARRQQSLAQHTLSDFERTIESLVLKANRGSGKLEDIAREIAASLLANPAFDTGERVLVTAGEFHGRGDPVHTYASGAPRLSSLLVDP